MDPKNVQTDLEYDSSSPLLPQKNQSYREKMKYHALLLSCLLSVGSYFCYDIPSALESHLTDPNGDFKLDHVDYNLLYSVYALPNTILPFFGGFLIDKMGLRIGIFSFSLLLTTGQIIILLGGIFKQFWLLILGRVFFGLGGESLNVTHTTIIAHWFMDSNIAFAMGANIAVSRLGNVINSALTPTLFMIKNDYFLPFFVGVVLCIFSFFCGIALCIVDKKVEINDKTNNEASADKIKFSDLKTFRLLFWSMVLNCMLTYGTFYSFNANANDFLFKNFNISNEVAGLYLMIVFLIAAFAIPFFGMFFDKAGNRAKYLMMASIFLVCSLLIINFLPQNISTPMIVIPLIVLSLFYTTYASVFWPSIPRVVEKKTLGSAYGILMSSQNLGIAITPLIFGAIQNQHFLNKEYFIPMIYLIFQGLLAVFVFGFVNIYDSMRGNKLY